MDKILEKSNEISAFIGLLIIELNQYEHQFCIEGGYMDSEIQEDLKNICKTLRLVQTALKNPLQYNDEIKSMINEYIDTKYNSIQSEDKHPTGYAFVIRAMCKKANYKLADFNISLFADLEIFFQKLGQYLNDNYFWRY